MITSIKKGVQSFAYYKVLKNLKNDLPGVSDKNLASLQVIKTNAEGELPLGFSGKS